MKTLIIFLISIILFFINSLEEQTIKTLRDSFEECSIPINHIESIQLHSSTNSLVLDTEEGINDMLNTIVINEFEMREDRTFDIPEETYLIFVGVIIIENLPDYLWSTFGIVWNEESDRYFVLIIRNNALIVENADICKMVEIELNGS